MYINHKGGFNHFRITLQVHHKALQPPPFIKTVLYGFFFFFISNVIWFPLIHFNYGRIGNQHQTAPSLTWKFLNTGQISIE